MVDMPDVEPKHLAVAGVGAAGLYWYTQRASGENPNQLPPGDSPPNSALIGDHMPKETLDTQFHKEIAVYRASGGSGCSSYAFREPSGTLAIPADHPVDDDVWMLPSRDVAGGVSCGLGTRFIFDRQSTIERFEYSGPVDVYIDGEQVNPNNPESW